jgi:hypothetical protein
MKISRPAISSCLLLLAPFCCVSFSQAQAVEECMETSDVAASCASDENRECQVIEEQESCGGCLEGFVEWQGRTRQAPTCFNISDLTWDDFLESYEPTFITTLSKEERFELLIKAIELIVEFRAEYRNATTTPSYELGLTPFSADSVEEYKQRSGFVPRDDISEEDQLPMLVQSSVSSTLPENVDWVDFGAVTSVKDQGRCGCCWTVSLAGAVEGSAFIQNGYLQSMSIQQYISCNDGNLGCDGGNLVLGMGYTWLNEFGGLATLNEYPYTDSNGDTTEECELDDKVLAVEIKDPKVAFDTLPVMQFEDRLNLVKSILAEQPISMSMKSACKTLSNYRKGIMTDDGDCVCLDPYCADHAVLMVGYDDTTDPPSFKLKNSWGNSWGEDGYFRVSQQETAGPYGLFGILGHGVIPGAVTNTTAQVYEEEPKERMETWAIILIIVACVVACSCLGKILMGMQGDKSGEETAPES